MSTQKSIMNFFQVIPKNSVTSVTSSSDSISATMSSTCASPSSVPAISCIRDSAVMSSSSCAPAKTLSSTKCDLGEEMPRQPTDVNFPKTSFGSRERSFSSVWYNGRPYLEYSIEKDAVFCFCCRKFSLPGSAGESAFRTGGFRNWKSALEKGKGFQKHESSAGHIHAMERWKEKQLRCEKGEEVCTLINETQLKNNRYYVNEIVDVVKFLVTNELAFRGDSFSRDDIDEDDKLPCGLFLRLFEYTVKKNPELARIIKTIPKIATYTSPRIQNEIIALMASIVQESIVKKCKSADVQYFTLKVDGTKDRTGTENVSIAIRFVSAGQPQEHLICISRTIALNAEAFTDVILTTLKEAQLDPKNIISQCYDGAAVMSGQHGGVQALLQERLQKEIPYVHCFNHKLHLVVVCAVSECQKLRDFFDICRNLYTFLSYPKVAAIYQGDKLTRLMEHRWTGHLQTTQAITTNYDTIVNLLEMCSSRHSHFSIDIQLEATGLLHRVNEVEFQFIAHMVLSLLTILETANNSLQGQAMDLSSACDVMDAVIERIRSLRNEEEFQVLFGKFEGQMDMEQTPKRRRTQMNSKLDNFIVFGSVGQPEHQALPIRCAYRQMYYEVVDRTLQELTKRFGVTNRSLYKSLACLKTDHANFLNIEELKTLATLCGVDLSETKHEFETAKVFLLKRASTVTNVHQLVQELYSYRDAFPSVYRLAASALTIGASTATCEATFSTLSRVLTPFRTSMSHSRKANLVLLSFESDISNNIKSDEFLRRFHEMKNRRLQLF
jgi:hypothetical protein